MQRFHHQEVHRIWITLINKCSCYQPASMHLQHANTADFYWTSTSIRTENVMRWQSKSQTMSKSQTSLIMVGAAELHPSRPIGIKRRKRCPGVRKLVNSIKKLGHSVVIFHFANVRKLLSPLRSKYTNTPIQSMLQMQTDHS